VQLHGSIGMTEEYAVDQFFRSAMVFERLFGDTARRLDLLAGQME
jgi:alkylation response protein AidB-like acyl-CoA dehydrogenase